MIWEKEFLKALKNEFQNKKAQDARYSIRQYAQHLDISVGALSEVMSNKRRLTESRALKIVEKMDIARASKTRIRMLMGEWESGNESHSPTQDAKTEHRSVIGDWKNLVILSLFLQKNKPELIPHVSKVTELSEQEVAARFASLQEIFPSDEHFIDFQIDLFQKDNQTLTNDKLSTFQENQLEFLKKSIQKKNEDRVQFYSLSLLISAERYEQICLELRKTLFNLLTLEPETDPQKLLQISLQLNPFSIK